MRDRTLKRSIIRELGEGPFMAVSTWPGLHVMVDELYAFTDSNLYDMVERVQYCTRRAFIKDTDA